MKLSTRSRYGLRLMLELAKQYNNGPVQLSNVSKKQSLSAKYLGQIVLQLKNSELINSERGTNGGYYLSRPPAKITVKEIVECLEGSLELVDLAKVKEPSIAIKEVWTDLNQSVKNALEKYSLELLLEIEATAKKGYTYTI